MEELKAYHALILDVWQAMKKQLQELDEKSEDYEFWTDVIEVYGEISKKYEGTPAECFAVVLCCDCMRELERVSIARRQIGKETKARD